MDTQGKLVYPAFLENWVGAIINSSGAMLWSGKCYFSKNKKRIRVTTQEDLVATLSKTKSMLTFVVGDRVLSVKSWEAHKNPDDSHHHVSFELLEGKEENI